MLVDAILINSLESAFLHDADRSDVVGETNAINLRQMLLLGNDR